MNKQKQEEERKKGYDNFINELLKNKDIIIREGRCQRLKNKEFEFVLCSHTIEHVDDPKKFYDEVTRIGKNIVLVISPLWDIFGAFLVFWAHKWIFLSFKKEHTKEDGKYSWSRAPRYKGEIMEVGPVARVINTYKSGKNKSKENAKVKFGHNKAENT